MGGAEVQMLSVSEIGPNPVIKPLLSGLENISYHGERMKLATAFFRDGF
jgi:hypothetical protein